MTNKEIKQLISTIESTLVSKQNQIARDQYNLKYKNSIIETQAVTLEARQTLINSLQEENEQLKEELKLIKELNPDLRTDY